MQWISQIRFSQLTQDVREVNKAVIQERHPMPTVDSILHKENTYLVNWMREKDCGKQS